MLGICSETCFEAVSELPERDEEAGDVEERPVADRLGESYRASRPTYALAAGIWRKLIPIRLNAFIAAMVIVRSTRSFGSNAADAAA